MTQQRDWPLLTMIGLSTTTLVLLGVVIVRAVQQGQAIEALQQRLQGLEQQGGGSARSLEASQLRQLGERLQRLESLASELDQAPDPTIVPPRDPLLPSPLPLTPPADAMDPAPDPLPLPPPSRRPNALPGLPLKPPAGGFSP
ncbi:MAG: hypothetical protein VKN13_02750 [Cyanobacteriota bacterium]|nr:hypothetical protein [Cyanobacteriota bacterium]